MSEQNSIRTYVLNCCVVVSSLLFGSHNGNKCFICKEVCVTLYEMDEDITFSGTCTLSFIVSACTGEAEAALPSLWRGEGKVWPALLCRSENVTPQGGESQFKRRRMRANSHTKYLRSMTTRKHHLPDCVNECDEALGDESRWNTLCCTGEP